MTRGIYETLDLDLAAFLEAATQQKPSISSYPGSSHATFHFLNDSDLYAHLVEYSTGTAMINAKRLLAARRRLFQEVRRVHREGRL